jgi:chromosome segregation ATPase
VSTSTPTLDRRRVKAASADAAADQAKSAVTDIDHQISTITDLTEQQEQALHRARDEITRLKRSLKAAGKRRAELTRQRKKAAAEAARARAKATAAEAKYDKEVLAELIRREKEKDRAAQPDRTPDGAPAGTRRTPARRGATGPEPEQPSEAATTARRTAARRTAKSARG